MRTAGGQHELVKIEARGSGVEASLQVVDHRRVGSVQNSALPVAKITVVSRLPVVEGGSDVEIMQLGIQHALFVVVVDLSFIQYKLLDCQIKDVGVAAALLP